MDNLSGKANYVDLFDKKVSNDEITKTETKTEIDGNEFLHTICLLNLVIENVKDFYQKEAKKDLGDALVSLNMARNSLINIE